MIMFLCNTVSGLGGTKHISLPVRGAAQSNGYGQYSCMLLCRVVEVHRGGDHATAARRCLGPTLLLSEEGFKGLSQDLQRDAALLDIGRREEIFQSSPLFPTQKTNKNANFLSFTRSFLSPPLLYVFLFCFVLFS